MEQEKIAGALGAIAGIPLFFFAITVNPFIAFIASAGFSYVLSKRMNDSESETDSRLHLRKMQKMSAVVFGFLAVSSVIVFKFSYAAVLLPFAVYFHQKSKL